MANKPALGFQVRDKLTGFKGLVTGVVEFLTGCRQFLVQPKMRKGEFVESRYFDEDRLEVLNSKALSLTVERAGFDKAAPRK
jgi:hypothetical protein